MKILVIGGSGFIGTRLVDALLSAGHHVVIFDKTPSRRFPERTALGDVRDAHAVRQIARGQDLIVHLAAEHRDDVAPISLYDEVNVGGTRHVVQAAAAAGVTRLIYASSAAVYGRSQLLPDEQAPLLPADAYGRSKVAAEHVCREWAADEPARSLVLLRPCVVYGAGNRGNVQQLIEHIRRGRFVMVGAGNNQKSMAYVGNLVEFICSQLDSGPGIRVYNYADKPDPSMSELVDLIRSRLGQSAQRRLHLPYAIALAGGYGCDLWAWLSGQSLSISSTRIRKFCADTRIATRALEATGFRPGLDLEQALGRTLTGAESGWQNPP